jgi:hypothetical protein
VSVLLRANLGDSTHEISGADGRAARGYANSRARVPTRSSMRTKGGASGVRRGGHISIYRPQKVRAPTAAREPSADCRTAGEGGVARSSMARMKFFQTTDLGVQGKAPLLDDAGDAFADYDLRLFPDRRITPGIPGQGLGPVSSAPTSPAICWPKGPFSSHHRPMIRCSAAVPRQAAARLLSGGPQLEATSGVGCGPVLTIWRA